MSQKDIAFATLYAEACHEGQTRKYTGEPYVTHPRRVAAQAAVLGLSDDAVIAGLLHDVVEDCGITVEELLTIFGLRVAHLVNLLSDTQTPADGNRAKRHSVQLTRIAKGADQELQTLKMLDLVDNARSISEHDPKFWATAVRDECQAYLSALDYADIRAVKSLKKLLADE